MQKENVLKQAAAKPGQKGSPTKKQFELAK